jgi:hypothetical protein
MGRGGVRWVFWPTFRLCRQSGWFRHQKRLSVRCSEACEQTMNWSSVSEFVKFMLDVAKDGRFMLTVVCIVGGLFCWGYHRTWEAFALMSLGLVFLFWSERARESREATRYVPPPPEFVARRKTLMKLIRSRGMPVALSLEEFFGGKHGLRLHRLQPVRLPRPRGLLPGSEGVPGPTGGPRRAGGGSGGGGRRRECVAVL